MLRILGSKKQFCDGITRRDWLQVGGLGLLGMGMADVLRLQSAQADTPADRSFGQAKSCILLLAYGSPPQHETFDPKPEAPVEVRGEMGAMSTNVPGIQICDHLPRIAQVMDRVTVVRSMTHPYPVHCTAYVTSGIPDYSPALESRPQDPKLWPYIGSCVDYVDEQRALGQNPAVPRNMALPWKMNSRGGPTASMVQTGPYAAFLGPAYDPVLTDFDGQGSRQIKKYKSDGTLVDTVLDPYGGIEPAGRLQIAGGDFGDSLSLDRLNRRVSLMKQLEAAGPVIDHNLQTNSYDRFQQMAFNLMAQGKVGEALDIHREADALRAKYGMTLFGQSCIAARRLVEAGGRFVTVFWDEYAVLNSGWDTHWGHNYRLKEQLLPGFDAGFSTLVSDLDERGMLDETLVVWMSEHGRTPRLNKNYGGGRDHWSRVYSIALAGGGVARGKVVGESDKLGGDVLSNPVSPKDILATILHLLGIDAHTTVPNQLGRPMPIAGTGRLRPELLA